MAFRTEAELLKLGVEGFALVDRYSDLNGKRKPSSTPKQVPKKQLCIYQYQPQSPLVYRVVMAPPSSEVVMDCYEAAKAYGGVVISDFPKRKPLRSA